MSRRNLFGLGAEMRDGVRLATDVALPGDASGRVPAVLVRTPYLRVDPLLFEWGDFFAARGYALVVQDVRGRGDSEGEWVPWVNEFDDGYDAVEWVAAQPWCNGRVGTLGGSYLAWVQWAAATRRPPHLAAMIPSGSPGRWGRDWPYRYGAFYAADYLEWLNRTAARVVQPIPFTSWRWAAENFDLPTLDAETGRPLEAWQHSLRHDTYDEYWRSLAIDGYESIDVPCLHVTGWWDGCAPGSLHHFREMVARSPAAERQSLLVGPWDHHSACTAGTAIEPETPVDFGAEASIPLRDVWERWFARWLKDDDRRDAQPPVRVFCIGANEWIDADAWPPARTTERSFYLAEGGGLRAEAASNTSTSTYTYDPRAPIASRLDLDHRNALEWEPRTELLIRDRDDVVVFRTPPVSEAVVLAGPVKATIFASSTGVDTEFVASVIHYGADGTGLILCDGILRASRRDSLSDPAPLTPGDVYRFDIEVDDICFALAQGDALGLAVSSSLVPNYHPNPNTGEPLAAPWCPVVVEQTVWHGGEYPSELVVFAAEREG